MRCEGEFVVGATAANAPSAIAKDTPAATHNGKAVLDRFRFEACFFRAIVGLLYLQANTQTIWQRAAPASLRKLEQRGRDLEYDHPMMQSDAQPGVAAFH